MERHPMESPTEHREQRNPTVLPAVRDGGGKHDGNSGGINAIVDDAQRLHINHVQLLQRQRMLGIVDIPEIEKSQCE